MCVARRWPNNEVVFSLGSVLRPLIMCVVRRRPNNGVVSSLRSVLRPLIMCVVRRRPNNGVVSSLGSVLRPLIIVKYILTVGRNSFTHSAVARHRPENNNEVMFSFGQGQIFLFSTMSRPVLGPAQPPLQ
jgi:hypothetical protein